MIKVNGAWYLDSLPQYMVVELADGNLVRFFISPLKELIEEDFTIYKGVHPAKSKGLPLSYYLYRFYGLEKNDEITSEVVHLRMTPTEKKKIEDYVESLDPKTSVSEVIRDYIKTLWYNIGHINNAAALLRAVRA